MLGTATSVAVQKFAPNVTYSCTLSAAPSISIAAPLDSTTIALPALIPVTFNVSVAVGKTISKIELYNQTNLLWDGSTTTFNWQPLAAGSYSLIAKVTDSDGNVGLSAPINVSLTGAASEIITWLHNDLGGNTIMASDSLGGTLWKENFTPFGDRVIKDATATSNNRQWFAGKPQDSETGLSYFGARYYDPAVGRFMGIDAARFSEGNLHSFNRYAYGNNNPLRFIDPTGNSALSIFDWKDFAVDVGGLYVDHIVYAVAKINGNEAVAQLASDSLSAGVVSAAISTVGVVNPLPGTGSAMRAAVKAEVKAVETAAVKSEKTFQTYTKTNPATNEVYSGRTSGTGSAFENVAARDANHHMNDKGFGPAQLDKSSSNANAIRGREQQLIDANGGSKRSGGTSGNTINGVGANNGNKSTYEAAAKKEFGQ